MKLKRLPPEGGRRRAPKTLRRFSKEQKLQAVRLYLEEGFPSAMVCQEIGVGHSCLFRWVRLYRAQGEAGLEPKGPVPGQKRLPAAITEKIIELKKENRSFGIKRISQLLRRAFFLPASPETVRRRLHEAELMSPPKRQKKKKNMTRPRFFERATPNQMWQTDIFTFRLGGRYAYLIAFMDDYSRYLVGAGLFRSPTAEAVIEVYRVAAGEFQPPKEMLTDNGRQYTSWRGTSRFEAELKKDRVAHFKSRPQHPMTLGKIERFWSSIWQEFLARAQFESFDVAQERIKLWIRYYNHKRQHQGIGGLCPADRYFEIQSALRETIETGIQENLLELALRGKPRAPFYMVGRMEGQSVILRAEKGKLKLSVDDPNNPQPTELTYDLEQKDPAVPVGQPEENQTPQPPGTALAHGDAEGAGRAGGVDRTGQAGGCLPSAPDQLGDLSPVAEAGDGGHAPGAGTACEPQRGPQPAPSAAAPEAATPLRVEPADPAVGTAAATGTCQTTGEEGQDGVDEVQRQSPPAGRVDHAGAHRPAQCHHSSPTTGHLPQDVLSMGTTCPPGHDEGTGAPSAGKTEPVTGPGETKASAEDRGSGEGTHQQPAVDRDPRTPPATPGDPC